MLFRLVFIVLFFNTEFVLANYMESHTIIKDEKNESQYTEKPYNKTKELTNLKDAGLISESNQNRIVLNSQVRQGMADICPEALRSIETASYHPVQGPQIEITSNTFNKGFKTCAKTLLISSPEESFTLKSKGDFFLS